MLTVEEARQRILSEVRALEPSDQRLEDALGSVVADDLHAPHPLPRFANSAMDGYAVRRSDIAGASDTKPIALALTGEIKAGDEATTEIGPGTAVRIMTGAAVPDGSDCVAPIEQADEDGDRVLVRAEPPPSGHIRHAGEDVKEGDLVLGAGTELGAGEAALLASLGLSPIPVHPRPRVAVVVTGDELVSPEDEPRPGQIRDSNSLALRAMVLDSGGDPQRFRIVGDALGSVIETLELAAISADLIVSAGGVSVGRYDFVKEAVEKLGAIDLWRVAMQPGKPVVSGRVGETPFLGLPGNPVSIHIGFEQFVRPVLRRLRGCKELLRPVIRARLVGELSKPPGRMHFVRVRLEVDEGGYKAIPTGAQGSHIQSSLIGCHGVARFDIEATNLADGAEVEVEVWSLPAS